MNRIETIAARLRTAAFERGAGPYEMAEIDALLEFVSALDPEQEMHHHECAQAAVQRLAIAAANAESWLTSRRAELAERDHSVACRELTETIATLGGAVRFVEDAVNEWKKEVDLKNYIRRL